MLQENEFQHPEHIVEEKGDIPEGMNEDQQIELFYHCCCLCFFFRQNKTG